MRGIRRIFMHRHTLLVIAIAVLFACRVLQHAALQRDLVQRVWFDRYLFCNGSNTASFLLVPLTVLVWMRPLTLFSSGLFASSFKSRRGAAMACAGHAALYSLCCSLAINVTATFSVLPVAPTPSDLISLGGSVLLQAAVLFIACMISTIAAVLVREPAISFLAAAAYGVWDFMAQNVVGGGLPSIGWGIAIASSQLTTAELLVKAAMLGSIALGMIAIQLIAFERADYVDGGPLGHQRS